MSFKLINFVLILCTRIHFHCGQELTETQSDKNGISYNVNDIMKLPEIVGNKFFYFGYGSNLLAKRIHIQNKSAVRVSSAKLENYRLDFFTNSTRWRGAPATIVPDRESYVWGAVWELDIENLRDLDDQEGVSIGIYHAFSVKVETPRNVTLNCRTYQLTNLPDKLSSNDEIPYNRQPSLTYLRTIIQGAIETGLPSDYVEFLRQFKHNNETVDEIEKQLELKNVE